MDHIMPISEVRENLSEIVKKIAHMRKHLIITRNGKAEAVLLSPEELETLEIKADQKLLQSIVRAEEDIQKGRLYSHQDIFEDV